jgi:hypothetical protein
LKLQSKSDKATYVWQTGGAVVVAVGALMLCQALCVPNVQADDLEMMLDHVGVELSEDLWTVLASAKQKTATNSKACDQKQVTST